jgi:glycosyltransferase involved in cell wall biosynthesis
MTTDNNYEEKSDLKILMIFDDSLTKKGAAVTHVSEVFRNLDQFCDVYLFSHNVGEKNTNDRKIFFVPTLNIPLFRSISFQIMLFFHFIHFHSKTHINIIYLRYSLLSFVPLLLSKIYRIPLVVEINGLTYDEFKLSKFGFINIIFASITEPLNFRYSDGLIAVTPGIKDVLQTKYSSQRISVIENGVNTELFKPINQEKARDQLKLNQNVTYLCFVGSLSLWQGVHRIIYAAEKILKKYSNIQFLIVGDGVLLKDLINVSKKLGVYEHFIFTGSVPYELVPFYINSSDICLVPKIKMPSGYSPLKLYEYLSCGKPVIATRTEGFEFLEDVQAGLLTDTDNIEAFADCIFTLINDIDKRITMGENGRNYVFAAHSWNHVAGQIKQECAKIYDLKNGTS